MQFDGQFSSKIQSNLYTTTTLGTLNFWSLLTGGRCSEVALCYKQWKWDPKTVVVVAQVWLFYYNTGFGDPKVSARDPNVARGPPVENHWSNMINRLHEIMIIVLGIIFFRLWRNFSHKTFKSDVFWKADSFKFHKHVLMSSRRELHVFKFQQNSLKITTVLIFILGNNYCQPLIMIRFSNFCLNYCLLC